MGIKPMAFCPSTHWLDALTAEYRKTCGPGTYTFLMYSNYATSRKMKALKSPKVLSNSAAFSST